MTSDYPTSLFSVSQAGLRIHSTCHHFQNPCRHSHMNRAACIFWQNLSRIPSEANPDLPYSALLSLSLFVFVSGQSALPATSATCPFARKLYIPQRKMCLPTACFFLRFLFLRFVSGSGAAKHQTTFLHESNKRKHDAAKETIVKKRDDSKYVLLSAELGASTENGGWTWGTEMAENKWVSLG